MAEKQEVTPEAEEIAPPEGTVAAEVAKDKPKTEEKTETVPLSVYLALKDDVKDLRKEIKESKDSKKPGIIIEGIDELAEKYPEVGRDFIKDILSSATSQAAQEVEKKYTPIIQKQEAEKQKEKFDKAFDVVFDKALKDNPELPKSIDKETIKALALTPSYKNTPVSEILKTLYGEFSKEGKSTTENDARAGADKSSEEIDFDGMTPSQREQVLEDPKARKKYFEYLDKSGK